MKRSRLIFLGILGLVLALGLTGCIISASPDNQLPITMDSGDKIDFAVTCSGGPNIWYDWSINGQWLGKDVRFFQGTSTYTFSPSTSGKYTITCEVHETIVLGSSPFPCYESPCPPIYVPTLWSGQRTWEVEVVAAD